MKPTRHSFRCGQPLGPGVAHHGMRNLVHHAQAHVASPRGERLPAQVADHLSDAAYVVVPVASVPGRSALDHVKLVDICQACGYLSGPGDWSHWLVALTVTVTSVSVTGTCHLALFLVSTY